MGRLPRGRHVVRDFKRESYSPYGELAFPGRPWGPWGPHDGIDAYDAGYLVGIAAGSPNARKDGGNWPLVSSEQDLANMRGLARVVYDSSPIGQGMVQRLADFVLGGPPQWQLSLRGSKPGPAGGTGGEVTGPVARCQRVLDEWRELAQWGAGPAVFDPTDPDDDPPVLHDRRREAFVRWRVDGEFLLRFFAPGWEVLPHVRWLEPELVGNGQTTGPDSFGVCTDPADAERVVGYHTRTADGRQNPDLLPAGRVVHLKANVVATVKRGLSDFFSVGADLDRVLDLARSQAVTGKVIADIAYIREHAPGTTEAQARTVIDSEKSYDRREFSVAGPDRLVPVAQSRAGTKLDVSAGLKYQPPPMLSNIPGFGQIIQQTLRLVGRKYGMHESLISGDASNNNYASELAAGSPFERAVRGFQAEWAMAERAIAYKVLAFACRAGVLSADDVRAVQVTVVPHTVALTDRQGEAQRAVALVTAKLLDPPTATAELGYDPAQVADGLADWNERFPDPMAGPTPGLFGESVLREGTVTGTDKLGRKYKIVDGKHVALNDAGGGDSGLSPEHQSAFRAAFGKVTAAGKKVMNTKAGRVLQAAEHKLSIAAGKTRDVAVNAAKRRGMTEEGAARLARTLALADFAGGYVTGGLAAATVSPWAGKAAAFLPSVSAVYLAYSTARNPKATWAAAKEVVSQSSLNPKAGWRDIVAAWRGEKHEGPEPTPAWVEKLAELLAGDDADWRQAVFLAALRAGHPADAATAIAATAEPQQ